MADRNARTPSALWDYSLAHPFLTCLALFAVAVFLRYLDIFVFGLAEAWGEALMHKALGFGLVLAYLYSIRRPVADIGLHGRFVGKALFIGTVGIVLIYALDYASQMLLLANAGEEPTLVFSAIDPKTEMAGGLGFAAFLLIGNVVNSYMEEGLFRGVMLRLTRARLSPWRANLFQAALFSIWHIVWPIRHFQTGESTLAEASGEAAFIMAGTLVSGLVFGYMYLKTDNLWTPWVAHFINNSVFNVLHIETLAGLDADVTMLYAMAGLGSLALIPWTWAWAKRWRLPQVEPWRAEPDAALHV